VEDVATNSYSSQPDPGDQDKKRGGVRRRRRKEGELLRRKGERGGPQGQEDLGVERKNTSPATDSTRGDCLLIDSVRTSGMGKIQVSIGTKDNAGAERLKKNLHKRSVQRRDQRKKFATKKGGQEGNEKLEQKDRFTKESRKRREKTIHLRRNQGGGESKEKYLRQGCPQQMATGKGGVSGRKGGHSKSTR